MHQNPISFVSDAVYVMCFSLILLSVDLTSPHVKNKMSKREFIRNTRNAVPDTDDDDRDETFGRMYDNVFLRGHVSEDADRAAAAAAGGGGRGGRGGRAGGCASWLYSSGQQPKNFIPGYLALFL